MKEEDMVTMATKSPIVTMNHGRETGGERLIRTPEAVKPTRLTRRGRMVVTGVSALLIGALSVGFATAAQATRAGSGSPGRYLTKVTVLPGQTLWSLAETHDPNADTRLIIQQIQQLNSMSGDELSPGEVLWVPRE
jgi:LysM repeat protein